MRALVLVQLFTHLVCASHLLLSLIENSPYLSYLLGKIAGKKTEKYTTKNKNHASEEKGKAKKNIRLDGK